MEKKNQTPEQKLAEYICQKYVEAQLERENYYDPNSMEITDPIRYYEVDGAVKAYNNVLYAMDDIRAGRL